MSLEEKVEMNSINYPVEDGYSIRKVTELSEFEKLGELWDTLANQQGVYKPFLCFDWFKIWLDHFLRDQKLLILLVHKQNELCTIAPCLIKEKHWGGINVRKIELIGNAYSPFRYFLFNGLNEGETQRSISYILRFLLKEYRNWDMVDLSGIPEEDNWFDLLRVTIKEGGLKYEESVCYGDWYLDGIDCSGDEYLNRLPDKIRKDVSYCKRRLQKMGQYEFRLIRGDERIDYYMDLYYGVYAKSWQEREGIGPSFHRDLAKISAKHHWLRLGFLLLNDYPIASQFWISWKGTAFILKTVYDQDFKKYSPGKILTSEMAKFAIDFDKVKTIDYVQGDEGYKQDWTPKRRERKGVVVFNNSIKGKSLELLSNRIRPMVNRNTYLRKAKAIIKGYIPNRIEEVTTL